MNELVFLATRLTAKSFLHIEKNKKDMRRLKLGAMSNLNHAKSTDDLKK